MVPVIDIPDYLVQISGNASQVNSGAFFEFLMTATYLGLAITLYPILKKHNESLALGYVGSRLVATAFNVIGVIILLLLLTLSQEFVKAGAPVSSHFQTIGELLRTGRDLVNHVGVILVLSMGGLMLYYLLYHLTFGRNSRIPQFEITRISPNNYGFPKWASNLGRQTCISGA